MDPLTGGLLSLGGGIINNLFAGSRQKDAQAFAAQQVGQQEAFQEHMRATAYQTAVGDMKAAGLNPMMMAGINTSVPSGGAATTSPAPVSDIVGPALSTAAQLSKLSGELNLMDAQTSAAHTQAQANSARANQSDAETAKTMGEIEGVVSQSKILKEHIEQAVNDRIKAQNERPYLDSAISRVLQPTAKAASDLYKLIPPVKLNVNSAKRNQSGWIGGNEVDTTTTDNSFSGRFGH